jgi:DNA-binding Xre family transcriptional regulator
MYDYQPYRNILKAKGIKQEELIKKGIINRGNASSLKNNRAVTTDTLEKLCTFFGCQFNDLVQHYKD